MPIARWCVGGLGNLPRASGQFVGQDLTEGANRRFAGVGNRLLAVKIRKSGTKAANNFTQILEFALQNGANTQKSAALVAALFSISSRAQAS